jgi:hypothetical protein
MKRRLLDIPFQSIFVDKATYDKLTEEEKQYTFLGNAYYKTKEFHQKYKIALFILLTRYYKKYLKNNKQIIIPDIIEKRNNAYMSASDELFTFLEERVKFTKNPKNTVRLKLLHDEFKTSEMYMLFSKEEKRNLNYKNFCEKIEQNMIYRKYMATNKDKVKILKNAEYIIEDEIEFEEI